MMTWHEMDESLAKIDLQYIKIQYYKKCTQIIEVYMSVLLEIGANLQMGLQTWGNIGFK